MSEESVATVTADTPAGPVTVSADQTPEQRFASFAKAFGAPDAPKSRPLGPQGPVVPGPLHFNGSARPAAAKPAQQPAEDPAAKVAAFDAEMQAKGIQTPRAPPTASLSTRAAWRM